MKENESALYSQYIIDGTTYEATPAELLDECMEHQDDGFPGGFADIVDETMEPPVTPFMHECGRNREYLNMTSEAVHREIPFRMLYPAHFTRLQIAKALLSRLWSKGHFRLGDLRLWAQWDWNCRPVGSMSAFYISAMNAGEYIYDLGVRMSDYLFIENDEESSARFFAWLPEKELDEADTHEEGALFKSSPYESRHPWISEERCCPERMQPGKDSWIIYIPFDTCSYRLGGSLLTQLNGHNGGTAPEILDPDYFIDCYEVVRELAEDGLVIAGAAVADGGLATAAERMCGECGMDLDINGIMASYQEKDSTKVLFSEVPGVLLQIRDNDFDYVDSQLILQDVAYYPVGRTSAEHEGLRLAGSTGSGVSGILASLLNQASEGED